MIRKLSSRLPLPYREIGIAALLTLGYLAVLTAFTGEPFYRSYPRLFHWDAQWYREISVRGYVFKPFPNASMTAGYLPAFPLLIRLVTGIFRVTPNEGLFITSILCCFGLWLVILLILKHWKVHGSIQAVTCALLFFYPVAHFLIAGYTESLFILGFFGLYYFGVEKLSERHAPIYAIVFGSLLATTRVVGIPLVFMPMGALLLEAIAKKPAFAGWLTRWKKACAICFISLFPLFCYFVYAQFDFKHWNIYFIAQAIGWGLTPDYLAPFWLKNFAPSFPEIKVASFGRHFESWGFSRFTVWVFAYLFIGTILLDLFVTRRTKSKAWIRRGALYVCSFASLYVPLTALAGYHMNSMSRYTMVPFFMLVLAQAHLATTIAPRFRKIKWALVALMGLLAFVCAPVFLCFFRHALAGGWIA